MVLMVEMLAACVFPHIQLNSGFLTSASAAEGETNGTNNQEGTEDEPVFDESMAGQYVINVVQLIELPVQCRSGQRYLIFVILKAFKLIEGGSLCLIWANSDTFSAVYTFFFLDDRMAVTDSDRLGRTSLDTVCTSLAS